MPKKFQRKTKKQYPMVEFTLPDIYGDAVFRLPALESLPMRVQRHGRRGDVNPMMEVLEDAGVDDETLDAIDDLDGEETATFMKAWSGAGEVPAGKSGS